MKGRVLYAILVGWGPATFLITLIVIVDAARRPDWQWKAAGRSRAVWVGLSAVMYFVTAGVGSLFTAWYYFTVIRRQLARADLPDEAGRAAASTV